MHVLLTILATFLASLNLLLAGLAFYRLRQPTTVPPWMMKVFISGLSPVLFLVGLIATSLGLALGYVPVIVIGGFSAILFLIHMINISRPPDPATGFSRAFGEHWGNRIPPERRIHFLPRRYVLRLPQRPNPVFHQNIPFYTVPETGRQLLCDIWEPPGDVRPTGLAVIYIHGSAWTVLDKDFGTRPFFRHLAAQGHVIMDIAYRLFPETGFMGMVHDVKHAIAWMKANADAYQVDPDRIVIGGGSAGGHLALLAAYTEQNPQLTPSDLKSVDTSVRGVISLYGQSDLAATYYHTCQHLTSRSALAQKGEDGTGGMPAWVRKSMGEDFHRLGFDKEVEPGMLAPMLGGSPDEKPEAYALFSPVNYLHEQCPPTLIIHGLHDILAPAAAMRQLYKGLQEVGVPAVMHLIPQTDHAFDLIVPKISPSAQNAYFDIERFLALMI